MSLKEKILFFLTNDSMQLSEIKDLSPENLEKKRLSLGQKNYLNFLKKLSGKIEARIVVIASTTGARNADLEDRLKLLQEEIKKIS